MKTINVETKEMNALCRILIVVVAFVVIVKLLWHEPIPVNKVVRGYYIEIPNNLPDNAVYYARKINNVVTIEATMSRDYNICVVDNDSIDVWSDNIYMGRVRVKDTALDSLITLDND